MEDLAHSQDLSPDDIIIAVMGITGSGKSTFISRCTGNDSAVGHSMQSCTRKVSYATIKHNGRTIRLIDTPGFDDSDVDDSVVLKEISYWLLMAYSQSPPMLLSGVIYLHPITNVRMKGTDKSNLAMFQALCGKESMSCVVMATTMWGKIEASTGDKRQANLSEKYWNGLVNAGTLVTKHTDTKNSALGIIDQIIEQKKHITLKLQHDLASGKKLQDTDAGQELSRKLNEEREAAEKRLAETAAELDDAQKRSDAEDAKEILEIQAQYQKEIQAKQLELERMRLDMQTLFKQKQEQLQRERQNLEEQGRSEEDSISKLSEQLSTMKTNQQKTAATPAKYEDVNSSNVNDMIKTQIQEHQLQMQLEREKHKREMEDTKRYNEMLEVAKVGTDWGKKGALIGAGGAVIAAGSLAADVCCVM
ncbi:hypothetical protein LOCC1_G006224 [Lachnellula occidentalis]|uniref:G domain-containing protein n=1 Tax=Lachnellula occidentalis TaxID=215460 RepID=A0A8H8RML2_9HELO|nr:hypothetical protein LOCC1_G006224 [Lachnellula occidentalis]